MDGTINIIRIYYVIRRRKRKENGLGFGCSLLDEFCGDMQDMLQRNSLTGLMNYTTTVWAYLQMQIEIA